MTLTPLGRFHVALIALVALFLLALVCYDNGIDPAFWAWEHFMDACNATGGR